MMRTHTLLLTVALCCELTSTAQTPATLPTAPLVINLQNALNRARQYSQQFQSASIGVGIAREDRVQAKAALLPSLSYNNQFIYTEANGTPSGVFVANDGVHVYNSQATVHQELFSITRLTEYRRAVGAEAVAKARADIAARGVVSTVVQNYYAMVSAQRKQANAQLSLDEARRFLDITQKQERGGEVAHADVIKAQLSLQQRQRDLQDVQLAIDKARIALAVLLFPDFRQDFSVVDDLKAVEPLAPLSEIQSLATAKSPDLRVAQASLRQADYGISIARSGYIPSLTLDYFYGINANQFAVRSGDRQNLGYSAQASLVIPVWNWGATQSKVRQADLLRRQAQLELRLAQKQLFANVNFFYLEAQAASAQVDSLRTSMDLATESLRLTLLRYQAGESTALEVVDAQATLVQARNAYDDGLARYRIALASLQTLTGTF